MTVFKQQLSNLEFLETQKNQESTIYCTHCQSQVLSPVKSTEGQIFCCRGCQYVYKRLKDKGLQGFYGVHKNTGGNILPQVKIQEGLNSYAFVDDEHFQEEHSKLRADGSRTLSFYVEGITCYACVWLIERLPELHPEILDFSFSPQSFKASITLPPKVLFAPILLTLEELGHRVRPLDGQEDTEELQISEERSLLKKIGVAGASFGNVMLLSVAEYAGVSGNLSILLAWLALFFSIPCVFYSAQVFYEGSWRAIKARQVNLDVPLALAVVFGFLGSFYHLILGDTRQYLDSVTGLVFLILITRYVMRVSARHSFKAGGLHAFFESGSVLVKKEGEDIFRERHRKYLQKNDIVQVHEGQILPADGQALEGPIHLNTSFMTGEAFPKKFEKGETIFAGSINSGPKFCMQVEKTGIETELGKILAELRTKNESRAPMVMMADRQAKYILSAILLIALGILIFFFVKGDPQTGVERFLSLMIVTCPCALALATPMAMARGMKKLLSHGILLKGEDVLEKLSLAKTIVLDKTGTLTEGRYTIHSVNEIAPLPQDFFYSAVEFILALESISSHPIARALRSGLEIDPTFCRQLPTLSHQREILGVGVEANYILNGKSYYLKITGSSDSSGTKKSIHFFVDQKEITQIDLIDRIRPKAQLAINSFKKLGLDIFILSGDEQKIVHQVAYDLKINHENAFGNKGPLEKKQKIEELVDPIMVGDGVNDTLALKSSLVGIAVSGSMEAGLEAASIYLTRPGVESIAIALKVAKKVRTMIKRNLIISLCYNSLGAFLAINGHITPLAAAIIMPVSSLTVLISTWAQNMEGEL